MAAPGKDGQAAVKENQGKKLPALSRPNEK